MNTPLQERGGANIGRSFIVPSAIRGNTVYRELFVGSNVLVVGAGDDNARLVGIFFSPSVMIYNNSGVALSGSLVWLDGRGNEVTLDNFVALADGATAGLTPNSKLGAFATLAPTESLELRLDPAVYLGGAVVSVSYQDFYQAVNARVDLDTTLKVMSHPLPGRAFQPANEFSTPVILNLDTIPHTVDIYVNDGVQDLLLYRNAAVAPGSNFTVASAGPGNGQSIKAMLKEPLSAPDKRVVFMPCFVQFDA